jgi:hypothetical protein
VDAGAMSKVKRLSTTRFVGGEWCTFTLLYSAGCWTLA